MKLTYYKQLDGVRGIAALMIIVFHFFQEITIKKGGKFVSVFGSISHFGQTGVTLFFVLSGFLITRILLASKESDNYFGSFYMRRCFRIFPLFYLFMVIYYVLMPPVPFYQQWYYWVYLQDFSATFNWPRSGPGHTWSLAVEEHFYLFWPLLVYYMNPKQLKVTVYVFFVLAFLVRFVLIYYHFPAFFFTFANMDALALGAFLSIHELSGFKKTRFYAIMIFAFAIPELILWVKFGLTGNDFIQMVKLPMISMIFFGILGYAVSSNPDNFFNRTFKSKFLTYTGKISYGMYIYHPLIYYFYEKAGISDNFYISFPICLAATYAVATLSFYLFENPILRFKKNFEYKEKPAPELAKA